MRAPAAARPLTVCGACAPLCRLDRGHPERVQFAAFIGDRNIFAGCKLMGAEAIARLVVIIPLGIVVEHPPGMLGTTRLMDQASGLVLFALPKSANATLVAMSLPSLGIDIPRRPTEQRTDSRDSAILPDAASSGQAGGGSILTGAICSWATPCVETLRQG